MLTIRMLVTCLITPTSYRISHYLPSSKGHVKTLTTVGMMMMDTISLAHFNISFYEDIKSLNVVIKNCQQYVSQNYIAISINISISTF